MSMRVKKITNIAIYNIYSKNLLIREFTGHDVADMSYRNKTTNLQNRKRISFITL